MVKLPAPTLHILEILKKHGSMTPGQLQQALPQYIPKDVKYALRRLREKGVIIKIPNLTDMRRVFYRLASQDEFLGSLSKLKTEELKMYDEIIGGGIYTTEIEEQIEI